MIDELGLIVDKTGDGGDSCNFTCCGILLGLYDSKPTVRSNAIQYFWNNGYPVRHPTQNPWNNPKNFTRDQAIPLMWVLAEHRIKKFLSDNPWFFPNFERDSVGSAKCPWPHRFYKDSRPSPQNFPALGKVQVPPGAELEFKWFDYADPMTPDFTAMSLILAGEKPSWFHMEIAKFLVEESIDSHCKRAKSDRRFVDFKQLYFTAKAFGMHKHFASSHPWGLHYASETYFVTQRSLPDLHQGFVREFKAQGIFE